jgi:DNA-binding response OmpR family regulator
MIRRLLVADRSRTVAEHLRKSLVKSRFEVDVAADGLDCVAKLRECPFDAVLIDEDLLWGGGDGAAAWLRHEGLRGLPVVMMTSHRPTGCDDDNLAVQYLQRPFAPPALLQAVSTALDV